MSVELSGVMTIPFGNSISVATVLAVPSGATSATIPGRGWLPAEEVEAETIDIGVPTTVDHDFIPAIIGHGAEVGMHDHRPVAFLPQEFGTGDEQPSIREPVNGPSQTGRAMSDYLAATLQIDRDYFAGSPVGEPKPALMPTRRFRIRKTIQQDAGRRYVKNGAMASKPP